MPYVPPHLRNRPGGDSASQADSSPRSLETLQQSIKAQPSSFYTLDDICSLLGSDRSDLSTLTIARSSDTASMGQDTTSERDLDGDFLRGIVLHLDQHPEWKTDQKVLCKSNLHVLHDYDCSHEMRSTESAFCNSPAGDQSTEYPLFEEVPFMRSKFEFAGWWRIKKVDMLAPRSPELIALFEKKFNKQNGRGLSTGRGKAKTRSEAAWHSSLTKTWAVISLERSHARNDVPESLSQSSRRVQNPLKGSTDSTVSGTIVHGANNSSDNVD